MKKIRACLDLFVSFFRIGILTFGGGLTMLPMLKYELVQKREWITEDDLLDCYAIGQCTPGIIAVNTATFVGCKTQGVIGGVAATLGMTAPSLLIITVLASFLEQFVGNVWVQHALVGVRGIVTALMVNTVLNLARKSLVNPFACGVCALAFLAVLLLKAPTVLVVFCAAGIGIAAEQLQGKGE